MIGNKNEDNFHLACCGCAIRKGLMLIAHRDSHGAVIGFLAICDNCLPAMGGKCTVEIKSIAVVKP